MIDYSTLLQVLHVGEDRKPHLTIVMVEDVSREGLVVAVNWINAPT